MDPVVVDTVRLGIGLLFAAALAHKLRAPSRFRAAVADYRLVPTALAAAVGTTVVVIEALTVLALVRPDAHRVGLAVAAALLVAYAMAIGANLARGRTHLDCGCVGAAGRETVSWWLVGRNLVCAAGALTAAAPPVARERVWIDGVTLVAATLALGGVYLAADQLVANRDGYRRLRGLA
jgi:hypothetical protein